MSNMQKLQLLAGHDAFLMEEPRYHSILKSYFNKLRLINEFKKSNYRYDFPIIANWINSNAKVLDLGCGETPVKIILKKKET